VHLVGFIVRKLWFACWRWYTCRDERTKRRNHEEGKNSLL